MVALLLAALAAGGAAAEDAPPLSQAERRAILSHGPWPPTPARDPSNRASGDPEAIELGRALFFDPRLSSTGTVSCATCHEPARAWTDGKARGAALGQLDRNTQGLANLAWSRWFGWGGSSDSLWAHNLKPIVDRREMNASPAHVAHLLRGDADLACRYARVFGAPPGAGDDQVFADAGKAMAAFIETLVSGRTPFDEYRDALERNDAAAMARYPRAAERGLRLFVGKGNCRLCHLGPLFANGEFHDVGRPFFIPGGVDSGRYDGIAKVRADRFNLLGPYSDDRSGRAAVKTRHVDLQPRNFGEFKVPGLRDVARTAPYMHDGSLPDLRSVVRHYSELDPDRLHADGERLLVPLHLAPGEVDDLVAFLESLTDPSPADVRPAPTGRVQCRP